MRFLKIKKIILSLLIIGLLMGYVKVEELVLVIIIFVVLFVFGDFSWMLGGYVLIENFLVIKYFNLEIWVDNVYYYSFN